MTAREAPTGPDGPELVGRPNSFEYSDTVAHYIARVPEDDPRVPMADQTRELLAAMSVVTESNASHRYAPGKWSIRQTIGHLTDTERILGYRALCLARGEQTPLPGFDENAYVELAPFDSCSLEDLKADFATARDCIVRFFQKLDRDAWLLRGTANCRPASVRGLAYTMVGHVRHHMAILHERYFPGIVGT